MGVDNMKRMIGEKNDEIEKGEEVPYGVQRLREVFKCSHPDTMTLNFADEGSSGRTCKRRVISRPVHTIHGQEGVNAGAADYRQGMDMENFDHWQYLE